MAQSSGALVIASLSSMAPRKSRLTVDAKFMGEGHEEFRALGYLISAALVVAAAGMAVIVTVSPAFSAGVTRLLWLLIASSGVVMFTFWAAVGSMFAIRRWIRD